MQRTSNYQLPQWEKEDRILMEDFNEMCANIESAIDGAKDEASGADQELRQEIGNCFSPENKPYVMAAYTGTGEQQTIDLGFRPAAVIVFERTYAAYPAAGYSAPSLHTGESGTRRVVGITGRGFVLSAQSSTADYPRVNRASEGYLYIALR